jgi:Protein of unknown function (DUF2630)
MIMTDEPITETVPDAHPTDGAMDRIQQLAAEAHRIYGRGVLEPGDQERLRRIRLELDQCWDLVRQRLALREAGRDPAQAQVRPSDVVESYKG